MDEKDSRFVPQPPCCSGECPCSVAVSESNLVIQIPKDKKA